MKIDLATIGLEELAGFVSEELRKEDIEIVFVGGACVSIYSKNRYQSYDLDFVTYEDRRRIRHFLKKLDFEEISGYFLHKDCPWIVEFVSPPSAIGDQPIREFYDKKRPWVHLKCCVLPIALKTD